MIKKNFVLIAIAIILPTLTYIIRRFLLPNIDPSPHILNIDVSNIFTYYMSIAILIGFIIGTITLVISNSKNLIKYIFYIVIGLLIFIQLGNFLVHLIKVIIT